jgi:hypothetical protein
VQSYEFLYIPTYIEYVCFIRAIEQFIYYSSNFSLRFTFVYFFYKKKLWIKLYLDYS